MEKRRRRRLPLFSLLIIMPLFPPSPSSYFSPFLLLQANDSVAPFPSYLPASGRRKARLFGMNVNVVHNGKMWKEVNIFWEAFTRQRSISFSQKKISDKKTDPPLLLHVPFPLLLFGRHPATLTSGAAAPSLTPSTIRKEKFTAMHFSPPPPPRSSGPPQPHRHRHQPPHPLRSRRLVK